MPRIDDYINACKISIEKLSRQPFETILKRSGFKAAATDALQVPFLNRVYRLTYPRFEFEDPGESEREIPLQEQVLILHYLAADEIPPVSGHWVSYREISGASFYFGAFVKRAIDPLKNVFGHDAAGLSRAAEKLQMQKIDNGDVGFELRVLPAVPLQLVLWTGDDEFPAEANILFDQTIGRILSPEDVAWLSGMVVYRLMALSR